MLMLRRRMPAEQPDARAGSPLDSPLRDQASGPPSANPVVHDRPDKFGPQQTHPMH